MPSSIPSPPAPLGRVTTLPSLHWLLWPLYRLFLRGFFRLQVWGMEKLPATGPLVLAPKHYSRWDPLLIGVLSRTPCWFMTTADEFGGFQGWLIRWFGAFPVDVEHPKPSSFRYALELLQAGQKLVLFPEGGIVRDRPLKPLKSGIGRLVLQAEKTSADIPKIPIFPVALHYQPDAVWRAKIVVAVGDPIYAPDPATGDEKRLAQTLVSELETALRVELAQAKAAIAPDDEAPSV